MGLVRCMIMVDITHVPIASSCFFNGKIIFHGSYIQSPSTHPYNSGAYTSHPLHKITFNTPQRSFATHLIIPSHSPLHHKIPHLFNFSSSHILGNTVSLLASQGLFTDTWCKTHDSWDVTP